MQQRSFCVPDYGIDFRYVIFSECFVIDVE